MFEVGVSLEVEGEGGVLEVVAVVAGEVDCLAVVSSCYFCSEVEAGRVLATGLEEVAAAAATVEVGDVEGD